MDCYGLVKLHKPDQPIRPIFTGYKSLTAGTDKFLVEKFSCLLNESKYEIQGPKDFKNKINWTSKVSLSTPKNTRLYLSMSVAFSRM